MASFLFLYSHIYLCVWVGMHHGVCAGDQRAIYRTWFFPFHDVSLGMEWGHWVWSSVPIEPSHWPRYVFKMLFWEHKTLYTILQVIELSEGKYPSNYCPAFFFLRKGKSSKIPKKPCVLPPGHCLGSLASTALDISRWINIYQLACLSMAFMWMKWFNVHFLLGTSDVQHYVIRRMFVIWNTVGSFSLLHGIFLFTVIILWIHYLVNGQLNLVCMFMYFPERCDELTWVYLLLHPT